MAGDPDQEKLYEHIQEELLSSTIAKIVYKTVSSCNECSLNSTLKKIRRQRRRLSASSRLGFVAFNIFGTLPRKMNGYQHIINMTDGYSRLTRAVPKNAMLQSNTTIISFFLLVVQNRILLQKMMATQYNLPAKCVCPFALYLVWSN